MRAWIWLISVAWLIQADLDAGTREFLKKPAEWFRSTNAQHIQQNIISWQAPAGSWPKNTDTSARHFDGDRSTIRGTFDNGATVSELRFLARHHAATGSPKSRGSFLHGFDLIIKAQYTNGGWPQTFPPSSSGYDRHITFNDGTMAGIMRFLREAETSAQDSLLDHDRREGARRAFVRGIQCILDAQIRVNGQLLAWGAQHHPVDLSPQSARSYELVSLASAESVEIVRLLMSLEKPSPAVVESISAAVRWLELVQITGVRLVIVNSSNAPSGKDRILRKDDYAQPLWARFYEIGSNRPIFAGRDGIKKYDLAEIEHERRNGYSWLGPYAANLLNSEYPAWRKQVEGSGVILPATAN